MHIEIKASEGKSYTLNDTLPSTLINEIYIFFDIKNNIVYINTTFNMIKEESKRTNKDIESIMKAANEEIKIFREKRKKISKILILIHFQEAIIVLTLIL